MNDNEHATNTAHPPARQVPDEVEVAVVGAGPTGLTIAAMLAAYGIRTVLLDKAAGPAGHSRAAVIHARTLEILEPLGIVDELVRRGVVVPHFGVRDRDRRLLAVHFDRLPTTHPYTLMLPQEQTEHLLRQALRRHGGEVLWRCEVTEVRQNPAGVDLTFRSARGSKQIRARFVVGCDGVHSCVRDAFRIQLEGATYLQSFVLADIHMDWQLPDDEVQLFFSPEGLVVVAPLPEGQHRVVATVDEAPREPSLTDVQALLDARGPRTPRPDVEEIIWSSRFHISHKIAARFREGAVFLCGDAAHVHSPAGGQGMNTGIQDAANLAWKLALVLYGYAGDALLDSYERERRPVAREVVSMTHRLTRIATLRSPLARRIRNVLIAGAGRSGWLPRRLATDLAQIGVAYHNGWSVDSPTVVERWASKGDDTLRDLDLAFRLVVPEIHRVQTIAGMVRYPDVPVRVVARSGLSEAVIVRPDGYVAGRSSPDGYLRLLGLLARALKEETP